MGARLAGGDLAEIDPLLHGTLDMMALALHYYLGETDHAPSGADWATYDQYVFGTVNGISTTRGLVYQVEGKAAVEGRDDFVAWGQAPKLGVRLVPTVDLLNKPWRAVVRLTSEAQYDQVAAELYGTLRLNESSTGVRRLVRRGRVWGALGAARIGRIRRSASFVVPLP